MDDASILTISEVKGAAIKHDGGDLVLAMTDKTGRELKVAIPPGELMKLIDATVTVRTKGAKALGKTWHELPSFELTAFGVGELRAAPESDIIAIMLRFGAEAEISYWMPGDVAARLVETLQSQLSKPKPRQH